MSKKVPVVERIRKAELAAVKATIAEVTSLIEKRRDELQTGQCDYTAGALTYLRIIELQLKFTDPVEVLKRIP